MTTWPMEDCDMVMTIGVLTAKARHAPPEMEHGQLIWQTGYQNAISDLIAELFPDALGGRRLTVEEMAENDRKRAEYRRSGRVDS